MSNEQLYILEVTKEDVDDIIMALDSVVKANGLSVAERCAQLHKILLTARPKPAPQPTPQPKPYIPTPEEIAERERLAKEKLEKELSQLVEKKPAKKRATKSTKKK